MKDRDRYAGRNIQMGRTKAKEKDIETGYKGSEETG